ncbi:sensor histidine kinase [Mucilaginibacter sp.]|uniref:sensor histidine kinase n=1 Tax=Mucilaginibacter sp. TaxID=1882438 RepID=UPI002615F11B|nr:sensor histidine kinase [Mucilaginibacter sp.]
MLHSIAWLVYFAAVYNGNFEKNDLNKFIVRYSPKFLFQAAVFYINYLYLIQETLAKLKVLKYLFFNCLLVFLFALCLSGLAHQLLWITFLNISWFLVLSILIRFSTDWFLHKQLEKEKENQHLKTELDFLKGQVNPHFFFNSLNNLYALSLKQAPETPETILKISGIMRYMLYETDAARVPIKQEVDMINTYISLQQLKTKTEHYAPIKVVGEIDTLQIEPLLLLPLIENVFKHGAVPIEITLTVTEGHVRLTTSNKINEDILTTTGGIGLINLKRRLALLYPDRHSLKLQKNDGTFTATLAINFSNKL